MRIHWVFLPPAIAVVAWVVPLVIGGAGSTPGGAGGGGAPFWVFVAYVVAGLSLLAFVVLLCVWAATSRRRPLGTRARYRRLITPRTSRRIRVPITETTSDPKQPSRLEKKANTRPAQP